ncbi:hypothetical protein [Frankia sp. AiPa1]|uniref:hypothetical protein n=1 Tax=Frankia sp. AiPa1 TaxID=573492 RepID=UPI00202B18A0|nr:hypothetical protein [Frankia sp. AiPa1]MCL9760865.1 hypothetical protein [Frankia sp. AiPa1]
MTSTIHTGKAHTGKAQTRGTEAVSGGTRAAGRAKPGGEVRAGFGTGTAGSGRRPTADRIDGVEAARRRARIRASVRAHHPDLGGDPGALVEELRELRADPTVDRPGDSRATVAPSPGTTRRAVRAGRSGPPAASHRRPTTGQARPSLRIARSVRRRWSARRLRRSARRRR